MAVKYAQDYLRPYGARPLSHARIAHAGNWISGRVTASGTAAAEIYAAEAPANSLTFEKWRADAVPATWQIAPKSASDLDYCAIAAHNFGSAAVRFSVEVDLGAGFVSIGLDGLTVSDDRPIFLIFEPAAVVSARIAFSDLGGVPEVGFIRFGKALQMEHRSRYPGRTPFNMADRRVMSGQKSVSGEFLARTEIRRGQSLSFAWSHLSEDWTQANLPGFLDAIERDLFMIAERPDTHPDDVALCWLSGAMPRPSASGAMDLHDLQISAEGYVNA